MSKRIAYYLPAIAVFVGVLGLWELAVRALGIQQFLLPPGQSWMRSRGRFAGHFSRLFAQRKNGYVRLIGGSDSSSYVVV